MNELLDVYVPRQDSVHWKLLVKGSAMVARPAAGDRVMVYLEGNIYGIPGLAAFEDKLLHAADRCRQSYPTVAVRCLPKTDLVQVGTYDGTLHVTNQAALDDWLIWRCQCGTVVDPDENCHLTLRENDVGEYDIVGVTCPDCIVRGSP